VLVAGLFVLQILQLYKEYIDPEFTWANFTIEEQAKVIVAPRSNNLLDTDRVSRLLSTAVEQQLSTLPISLWWLCMLLD